MTTIEDVPRSSKLQHTFVWVVGYLAVLVSVVLAVRFAYASADTTIDAVIRAGAAAVAAIVGCHGPAWIFRSLRSREWGTAILAVFGFAVCLAVTIAGGIGTIAAGSDKSLASRANSSATYADRRKELESLRDKRSRLPASRPAGTIESDMTAARTDRRWSSSSSCTDVTATASRTFCADYARLQGELEAAKEAATLDEKIHELTLTLAVAPAVRSVNPQATVIARLLHIAPEDAEAWYALLFALAVEAAAMSVLLVAEATTHQRQGKQRTEMTVITPAVARERDGAAETGRVLDWMRVRATPTEEVNPIALDTLHADYEVWCMSKQLQAMTMDAFVQAFDRLRDVPDLAGSIQRFGNRYYGIKLVDRKVAKLPVQRRGRN